VTFRVRPIVTERDIRRQAERRNWAGLEPLIAAIRVTLVLDGQVRW
jgi:hypothetical protein